MDNVVLKLKNGIKGIHFTFDSFRNDNSDIPELQKVFVAHIYSIKNLKQGFQNVQV